MSTDLLAPLTAAELNQLGDRLYRAFNRLCDAAEEALAASEDYRPGSSLHASFTVRATSLMNAMSEVHDLHTETVFGPRPDEQEGK